MKKKQKTKKLNKCQLDREKTLVRSHQLGTASQDQRENPSPWKPPERRREDRLKGYCEWGDVMAPAPKSLLRRQRERERERGGGGRGGGPGCGCCLRRLARHCTDVVLRQIHHAPVRHQSGTPRVMFSAAGAERRRGENGEMRLHRCGHVLREFHTALEMQK